MYVIIIYCYIVGVLILDIQSNFLLLQANFNYLFFGFQLNNSMSIETRYIFRNYFRH